LEHTPIAWQAPKGPLVKDATICGQTVPVRNVIPTIQIGSQISTKTSQTSAVIPVQITSEKSSAAEQPNVVNTCAPAWQKSQVNDLALSRIACFDETSASLPLSVRKRLFTVRASEINARVTNTMNNILEIEEAKREEFIFFVEC